MTADGLTLESTSVQTDLRAERNLRVNTLSLMLSTLVTGALGLVFWGAAARLFPAREVGLASALITSAAVLSTLSILSIDTLYERFLPLAGTRAASLLRRGFLLVAAVALLAGALLATFGPRDPLFKSGWAISAYPVLVMVMAVFTLQDKAATGLGVARWSAAKNAVHALAKVVVLFALAATDMAGSIVFAWGATAAVVALCIQLALQRRSRRNARCQVTPSLPARREIWSYFGSSFAITACWATAPLVVPLIIVTQVGPEASAYFAISWALISGLYVTMHLVVSPYVAEVAAHPHEVASLSWRMVGVLVGVTLIGSVGLVVVGPLMLSIAGPEYRIEGQNLLYLAALFVPLSAVTTLYEGFARVQRRLRLVLAVRCMATVVIVVGSLVATRSLGVSGVGWAYLAAEALSATVLLAPTVLWLRGVGHRRVAGQASPAGEISA